MKRLQTPRCFLLPVSIGDEEALLSLYTNAQAREFLGGGASQGPGRKLPRFFRAKMRCSPCA